MQLFPSRRAVRRAQTRLVLRFFGLMAVVLLAFAVVVVLSHLFGR